MKVKKRDSSYEEVNLNKITQRIKHLCFDLNKVDPIRVAISAINSLYDGISTEEIDLISAKHANSLKLEEPEYDDLAGRILVSNLHKNTSPSFYQTHKKHFEEIQKSGRQITQAMKFILQYGEELDRMVIPQQDYDMTYFSFTTYVRQYSLKLTVTETDERGVILYTNGVMVLPEDQLTNKFGFKCQTKQIPYDRPQYYHLRVAVELFYDFADSEKALKLINKHYKQHSAKYFTHATPTLQNSCTLIPQLDSCFLYLMEDSREGILKCVSDTATISAMSGGIGISVGDIRPRGSIIKTTGGPASGAVSMMKMLD
jgi:ribonucleoside-diphosphate reductase alpha chain